MLARLMDEGVREVPPVELVMLGLLMVVGLVAAVVMGLLLLELMVLVQVLGELWFASFGAPAWALVAAVVEAVDGHHQMKLTENPTI